MFCIQKLSFQMMNQYLVHIDKDDKDQWFWKCLWQWKLQLVKNCVCSLSAASFLQQDVIWMKVVVKCFPRLQECWHPGSCCIPSGGEGLWVTGICVWCSPGEYQSSTDRQGWSCSKQDSFTNHSTSARAGLYTWKCLTEMFCWCSWTYRVWLILSNPVFPISFLLWYIP